MRGSAIPLRAKGRESSVVVVGEESQGGEMGELRNEGDGLFIPSEPLLENSCDTSKSAMAVFVPSPNVAAGKLLLLLSRMGTA